LIFEKVCLLCRNGYVTDQRNQKYCGSWKRREGCSGVVRGTSHNTAWHALRAVVLARDDFTCQECRVRDDDPAFMDVDHRDSDRANSELSNLWTLCPNCHRRKTIEDRNRGVGSWAA
jgi:5-methylcytosine-specific restriction endonuclease McrA